MGANEGIAEVDISVDARNPGTDLERVNELAAKLRSEVEARRKAMEASGRLAQARAAERAGRLQERLDEFTESLRERLPVRVTRFDNEFQVFFGDSRLFRRPARAFRISCHQNGYGLYYLQPVHGIETRPGNEWNMPGRRACFDFDSMAGLVEHLTAQAAESIAQPTTQPPAFAGGAKIAVFSATSLFFWVVAGIAYGIPGALLGWIPAVIAGGIAAKAWPAAVVLGVIGAVWVMSLAF